MRRFREKIKNNKFYIRTFVPIALLCGIVFFFCHAGTYLIKSNPLQKSDAIIGLMGSLPDVVLNAADLYHKGVSSKIIISRESQGGWTELISRGVIHTSGADQFKEIAIKLGIPSENITILPGRNKSTIDEALIISEFLKNNPDFEAITLVCSASHSRRAGIIFTKVFKSADLKIHLSVSPSPYSNFDGKKWWADREKVQVVITEWIKLSILILVEQWSL